MRKIWKKIGIGVMALGMLFFSYLSWIGLLLIIGLGFSQTSHGYGNNEPSWFFPAFLLLVVITTVFFGYKVYKNIRAKKYDRALFWATSYIALPWILMSISCGALMILEL